MPGLPRKSTSKQFSKLMKKSGKSKTNTKAGAYDTSKTKISTVEKIIPFDDFKIFEEKISLDTYYKIVNVDKNGDEREISIDEDFNPYSLKESLNMFFLYKKKYRNTARINLILKKVTETQVDIEQAKVEIDAENYNL